MKLQQSHSPTENSSRFRQLVKSYWHSIVVSDVSAASTEISRESSVDESKIGEEYKLDSSLTNDIVSFVCNSEVTDVESLRRAINCKVMISFLYFSLLKPTKLNLFAGPTGKSSIKWLPHPVETFVCY